ncbi:hypothetical protein OG416_35375 (plasmid) [Streptomyces longwoodensis]|nr:hypothetical protein OG416_35375 [Streptomyces longwoodensis]
MNARRLAAAFLLPAAACGGLLASTAPPASAAAQGSCGDTRDASTSGAQGHWTINCSSTGTVSVTGWVKDTDADGQCAQVYAYFPATGSYQYSAKACPKGDVKYFTLNGSGTSANVYLREVG